MHNTYMEKKRAQKQEQSPAFLYSIANKIKELPEYQSRHTAKYRSFGSDK